MRAAEASGAFVYIAPEGEEVEFVDAPQQPEKGIDSLNEEVLITPSAPVMPVSMPVADAPEPLVPTPAAPPPAAVQPRIDRKMFDWDEDEAEDWGFQQTPQNELGAFVDLTHEVPADGGNPDHVTGVSQLIDLDKPEDLASPRLVLGMSPELATASSGYWEIDRWIIIYIIYLFSCPLFMLVIIMLPAPPFPLFFCIFPHPTYDAH
ncbi:hypothetical protein C7M84_022618 [Penaeus vannamei]|uniref:Uncharacterized protein n=1 Tax=Penaeus vannamei TaxID=6689 RepID=A0A423U658_PENVA|nr:hypothetical protein C7M84_022618 [Penaeus vannamei]